MIYQNNAMNILESVHDPHFWTLPKICQNLVSLKKFKLSKSLTFKGLIQALNIKRFVYHWHSTSIKNKVFCKTFTHYTSNTSKSTAWVTYLICFFYPEEHTYIKLDHFVKKTQHQIKARVMKIYHLSQVFQCEFCEGAP